MSSSITLCYRPPGSDTTRTYSVPTLLRWRRRYRKHGLVGLRPVPRCLGDALALSNVQRELLLEIRRQHPRVPANVILETLVSDGRIEPGRVSPQTVRRLFRRHGLARRPKRNAQRPDGARRRWEAGASWRGMSPGDSKGCTCPCENSTSWIDT